MLTVHHLSKSYELQTLFENVSFSLNPGERIGLVGPNGCGKTTLLRILAGEESASSGTLSRDPRLRIGYLPQASRSISHAGRDRQGAGMPRSKTSCLPPPWPLTQAQDAASAAYDDLLRRIQAAESGRTAQVLAGLA
jgi:ATPase subunit of ABC transporter with duplicated ATPase domains